MIHRYKFLGDLACGAALAGLMAEAVAAAPPPQLLVPVPLSRRRLRRRGFDQALELARLLSRRLRIPLALAAVDRLVDRPPQSSLRSFGERRRNVRGVFHVEPAAVAGRHVALVDDVMTSGATVRALAGALRSAGARRVDAWVACRTGS